MVNYGIRITFIYLIFLNYLKFLIIMGTHVGMGWGMGTGTYPPPCSVGIPTWIHLMRNKSKATGFTTIVCCLGAHSISSNCESNLE